jgi:hypothetical protein
VNLGAFLMPSHPPERRLYDAIQWDLAQLPGAHLLPYHHPVELAHRVASLDHPRLAG